MAAGKSRWMTNPAVSQYGYLKTTLVGLPYCSAQPEYRAATLAVGGRMSYRAISTGRVRVAHEADLLPSLAKLLDTVHQELDDNQETAKAFLTRATSLLRVEIDRRAVSDETERRKGGLTGWQASRLTAFIDAGLDRPITLNDLSEVSKLSTTYFCRAFKRTFGETPHSYIVRRRLKKAETLMLTSDVPLSDIAFHCGFADQAHLCKVFRRQHAQSPAVWRRERTETGSRRAKPTNEARCLERNSK
jgi:AraC family transcriptional regulator